MKMIWLEWIYFACLKTSQFLSLWKRKSIAENNNILEAFPQAYINEELNIISTMAGE